MSKTQQATTEGILAAMSNLRVALLQTPSGMCADYMRAAYSALEAAHVVESKYAWALKAYGDKANWLRSEEGKPVWIGPGESGVDLAQKVFDDYTIDLDAGDGETLDSFIRRS